jgi:hypothetical protein
VLKEVVSKITSFIDSGKSIRMWEKGGNPSQVFITSLSENNLKVECKEEDSSWQDKTLLFNFTFNNVDYFAKGAVSSVAGTILTISLEDELFKSEKRMNERLLAFPHHQVYSYFQFASFAKSEENVLSFNRSREMDEKVFESFLKDKQKHQNLSGDIGELFGFRALDISANGVSFAANNQETKYFACLDEDQDVDFTLMFNGEAYSLKKGKVVYIVDYVNPRARAIPMKKIGIQFELQEALKCKIDQEINESIESRDLEKDFESFLDN